MAGLWEVTDGAVWRQALAAYPAAVAARGKSRLPEIDSWYRLELPSIIAARHPPHVTLEELARVTEWKMKRGAWRARNLGLVRGNPAAEVERVSTEAMAAIPDPRRPVALLATLAGVGPATASAVLAAVRPDVYPFFDEEVAGAVPGLGPVAFTLPYYLRYAERLRERAAALSASAPSGGADTWSAHAVGQATWCAAVSAV